MSLFSSLQLANNSLIASQIGLQVTGNNIANANTPGYIREKVELTPAPTQKVGNLLLGLGVEVSGITQQFDRFLQERLRSATSDLAYGETQERAYVELETIFGELADTDLSTSLSNFFGSLDDILNQPESNSVRNLAVLQGETLAGDITRLNDRLQQVRSDLNVQVNDSAKTINGLLDEISQLNIKIVTAEGGRTSNSDAVGLRDQREAAITKLAEILDVRAVEQPTGDVTIFAGGDYLVFHGSYRAVKSVAVPDRGLNAYELQIADSELPLRISTGKLGGLISARDEVLAGAIDQLNEFAQAIIYEFNKVYTSGQGLVGHNELTSEFSVDDVSAALDSVGLPFSPVNGSLQVQVFNKQTGLTKTTDLYVKLGGLDDDTSLEDLTAQLDGLDGISAVITASRRLVISADSPNVEFAFANDTSGVLASLGIGTFFTGSTSGDIGVSQVVRDNPAKFAASRGGIGADTENAVEMAQFMNRALEARDGSTLSDLYDQLIGDSAQGASVARSVAEGFRVFKGTLEGQHLAITGVSIDEEAIRMITYQRTFQASAKFIATISDLLDVLVNL